MEHGKPRIRLTIPLSNDGYEVKSAVIFMPQGLSVEEWNQFHAVLGTMKPVLVAEDSTTPNHPIRSLGETDSTVHSPTGD